MNMTGRKSALLATFLLASIFLALANHGVRQLEP